MMLNSMELFAGSLDEVPAAGAAFGIKLETRGIDAEAAWLLVFFFGLNKVFLGAIMQTYKMQWFTPERV
jgi:hypothetical protein